ncbi:colicin immunity domain-containing protein [Streptomyces fagopyri]|uniref:colicin immunity domain-containing protein n=1 Tax=Streptomyces fagopyri TaxID=2662397 RepID=UPI0037155A2B
MGEGDGDGMVLHIHTADLKRAAPDFQEGARNLSTALTNLVTTLDGPGHQVPSAHQDVENPRDVPATSQYGHQLSLMRQLVSGAIDGSPFARQWLEARRRSMDTGERVGNALTTALDEVFYALEDYSIDPSLRDEDDLTDEELRERVADALARLE